MAPLFTLFAATAPMYQADVYVYLHKKLDENFVVIAGLEEKLDALEEENERLRSGHHKELEAARSDADAKIHALTVQVTCLSDELRALEEFRSNREAVKVRDGVARHGVSRSDCGWLDRGDVAVYYARAFTAPPLQSEVDRLQQLLETERADRQREVAELERRNVAAKDKLKTEMFDKIKETKTVSTCRR